MLAPPVAGCQNRVFKLDTTEINESSFILPIGGFHTLTVYGLFITHKKIKFHVLMRDPQPACT